ncbi:MAG: YHYH protein [Pseudomonadales bacterium]|nr:YHYH protein [Pseudomonadales bacterium]
MNYIRNTQKRLFVQQILLMGTFCGSAANAASAVGDYVFLDANETYDVDTETTVLGNSGNETLRVIGTGSVKVDANVERIEFSDSLSAYQFAVQGTQVTISGANITVTILGLNTPIKLAFMDGSVGLNLTGLGFADMGGAPLTSSSAAISTALDTTDPSTISDIGGGTGETGSLTLSSDALKDKLILPLSATCDGAGGGTSIPLSWVDQLDGTLSYAVTMHHFPNVLDEGDWSKAKSYWILFDIPASVSELADGQTQIGTFGLNTVNDQQAYSAPCSQGVGDQEYVITLYSLSAAPGQLGLSGATTDLQAIADAVAGVTLDKTELTVVRSRYNPTADDHVPTSVATDCDGKKAAFDNYSDRVSLTCDSTTMTVTSTTSLPERAALDADKPTVGITAWIGRVPLPTETTWSLPLSPAYNSGPESNILIHYPIGITVDGVPMLHYAKESVQNEVAQLGEDYSDRDTALLGEIDQCGGHAGNGEDYHYHAAPVCMMDTHDPSQPLAYMFDGIPLYFGTGGGQLTGNGVSFGGGRYDDLNYLPSAVKADPSLLDDCNAYDLHGDGSALVYYTTAEAPYTIACFRADADQEGSAFTFPQWDMGDRDISWSGSDVVITDYYDTTFDNATWSVMEMTPGESNNKIAAGNTALILYRQLQSGETGFISGQDCWSFRYRVDKNQSDGSGDIEETKCRK